MEVKYFDWDIGKNELIKEKRSISFEEAVIAITEGYMIKTVDHPNRKKYPNQKMFIVNIKDYIYLVPFVEDDEKIFIKTVIPSRKATREYLVERRKK